MFHPVASDLTMAEAKSSRINAFGIAFERPLDGRVFLGRLMAR